MSSGGGSRSFAPLGYQRQLQAQPVIPTFDQEAYNPVQYYSVPDSPVTSYQDPTELNRNRRHDTSASKAKVDDGGGRGILSSSAINRITETLGALNQVGRYLVNMTRGEESNGSTINPVSVEEEEDDDEDSEEYDDDEDEEYSDESDEDTQKKKKDKKKQQQLEQQQKTKQSSTTSTTTTTVEERTTQKNPVIEQRNDNLPEALPTLNSTVSQNLTKPIEPLWKRVPDYVSKEVVEVTTKKRPKNKTNKKKKRENIKSKIDTAFSSTTKRITTTSTSSSTSTSSTTTSTTTPSPPPQASFLQNIPSVVPTPTGTSY